MKLTADNEAINYLKDCFNKDFIEITVDGEKKIFVSEEKLKEKDKIIDLMAIAISNEPLPTEEYCIFRNFDCPEVGGKRDCKECVKQYFERKVENEN